MEEHKAAFKSIDEYIARFAPDIQDKLQRLRQVIKEAAPEAGEKISYQMPTFTLQGNLVHFAAYKGHIGFYPGPSGIVAFQAELAGYKGGKGTVQFPLDEPLPYELISRIVRFRAAENLERAASKLKRKNSK